ncbi:IS4 family transposase [Virgibacillus dokdonensis]|uniref:Transposase DDE domain protein n=4 Tax=Virgibacillus dokdonensis TaxID=302167 RepID=A0A2K9IX74_9BACI|nr:IS4 family transposase [Virgibacillus dokdonensis]AUJ24008.1 Transposase DDE domain protein [Virgibacillus dokdonensis]AUJ24349.1 Transposase DDE domain protein [Virgibacillus dokdonensis]
MDKNTLKSSFGKWVSPINTKKLFEQVEENKQDYYTKKLTTAGYIKLMLLAQLQGFESLEEMSDALIDDGLQKALGFESISTSQLSRKNNEMNPMILSHLFLDLVYKIKGIQFKNGKYMPLKIIDSSTLPLNLTNHKWAKFRKTKAGVKLHLRLIFMNKDTVYPEKAVITTAKEHDRNQLEVLVDDKEAMYVFDRGYVDYERFDRMTDEGYFFVSRLKKNAITREVESFSIPKDSTVLSDKMVYIGSTQNRTENVFRLLEVVDTKGNILRLITNRFDLNSEEISEIYRQRWAIELFFKWLKQHVEIKHFYGMSETAIQNQIFLALIAYCLHVLIQLEMRSKKSLLRISRWLNKALWKPAYIWIRRFDDRSIP